MAGTSKTLAGPAKPGRQAAARWFAAATDVSVKGFDWFFIYEQVR
jgi:hypothetical protein